jgi:nitrogen fixation protein NifQ
MAMLATIDRSGNGAALYRMLTGCSLAEAAIFADRDFDAHVFACLLAVAATEQATEEGTLCERLGLGFDDLAALVARWFPHAWSILPGAGANAPAAGIDGDEIAMLRELLLSRRATPGDDSRWLAAMVARRAMEPNHLWEDLGLRDRSELSRLLMRHFAPLASRNTRNMRWKRFFYRTLCEDDGLVMCSTPVCTSCADFALCFGAESGESRLAYTRREVALKAAVA